MNKPERIIVHHSLTADNLMLDNFTAIKNYHIKTNGWSDIGYHRVLESDKGKLVVKQGRAFAKDGAHCKEQSMNTKSIGFCIVGNFDIAPPTEEVYRAAAKEIKDLRAKFGDLPIDPHGKYATYKSCPGTKFDMAYLEKLSREKEPNTVKPNVVTPTIPTEVNDVSQNHWAYAAIEVVKKTGIMSGSPNGDFSPEAPVTRAQLAQTIFNLLKFLNKI
jgi:hypothetical protein